MLALWKVYCTCAENASSLHVMFRAAPRVVIVLIRNLMNVLIHKVVDILSAV
jgi:hypothetical protein